MSNDKRSVSTDALETLGTIIDSSAERDAIHLAVEPVVAAEKLYPGQDVGFVVGGVGKTSSPLGIVDPFLKAPVQPGEVFWLVVYPRQITSLRHVWSHPAFPEAVDAKSKKIAEAWLRQFLADGSPSYDEIMERARGGTNVTNFGYQIEYREVPNDFYDHLETLTGRKFTDRPSYFHCAC